MRIGYARVSTEDQTLDLQRDALKRAECREVYEEQATGQNTGRPQLDACLKSLREGDTLSVWRLDRLGRNLAHLVALVAEFERRKINFESLTEKIETSLPGGRLVFHVFAALAEFERNLIRERTVAGLKAARARGRKGGRPVQTLCQRNQDHPRPAQNRRYPSLRNSYPLRNRPIHPLPHRPQVCPLTYETFSRSHHSVRKFPFLEVSPYALQNCWMGMDVL